MLQHFQERLQNFKKFKIQNIIVRTDCARVKNFKNFKLDKAADRGRLLNWQLFLNQYDYNVELIAGNKNYLPDALTREMTMFRRTDKGKGPAKDEEESLKNVLETYTKVPKRTLTTDQSQGKGLASPSQTVGGKGTSNPLTAVALPKSKPVPIGTTVIHGYQLLTFDKDVYRTGRKITA